jgi:hypothetical protein
MAEKDEKDLPIREQEDGTVLVAVEEDKDPFEDQKKNEKALATEDGLAPEEVEEEVDAEPSSVPPPVQPAE